MKLNSLNFVKNIFLQHHQKPYSLYKFSSKHVSGWCQKKLFFSILTLRPLLLPKTENMSFYDML